VSPVDNMPGWLQTATWANPLRHFVMIAKSIYLEGAVFDDVAPGLVALAATAVVTGGVALSLFRRRLG